MGCGASKSRSSRVLVLGLDTAGLFYVIDSSDRERFSESREVLHELLEDSRLKGVPLVVLANKQDLQGAAGVEELAEVLQMSEISDRSWYIKATCATTGDGLGKAMKKMYKLMKDRSSSS